MSERESSRLRVFLEPSGTVRKPANFRFNIATVDG
jgi:hypothetical protein